MASSRFTLNILLAPVGSPLTSHRATSALALLLPHLSRCTRVALEDVPAAPPASFPSLSFDARVLHVSFSLHAPSPVDADADATRLFASGALSGVLAVLDARGIDDIGPAVDDATRSAAALLARHGLPTASRDAPAAGLIVLNASADAMARFASRAQPSGLVIAVDFLYIAEPSAAGGGGSVPDAADSDAGSTNDAERVGMHVGLIVSRLLAQVMASLDADAAAAAAAASASGGGSTGGVGLADANSDDSYDGAASGSSGAPAGSTSPRTGVAQNTLRIPPAFTGRRAFGVDVCALLNRLRTSVPVCHSLWFTPPFFFFPFFFPRKVLKAAYRACLSSWARLAGALPPA